MCCVGVLQGTSYIRNCWPSYRFLLSFKFSLLNFSAGRKTWNILVNVLHEPASSQYLPVRAVSISPLLLAHRKPDSPDFPPYPSQRSILYGVHTEQAGRHARVHARFGTDTARRSVSQLSELSLGPSCPRSARTNFGFLRRALLL